MVDLDNIQKRILEAQRQKDAVLEYERQQAQEEAARQRAKEDADKALAVLQQQEAAALWQTNLQANGDLLKANHEAVAAFQRQLLSLAEQIRPLIEQLPVAAVEQTFSAQQEHAYDTVSVVADSERARHRAERPQDSDESIHRNAGYSLLKKHRSIRPALPLWAALVESIASTPDEPTRRILQGLALMLTRKHFQPGQSVDRAALENDIRGMIR